MNKNLNTSKSVTSKESVSKMETVTVLPPAAQPATRDSIKLIALSPDAGTENLNAILIPVEDVSSEKFPLTEEEQASLVHYEAIIKRGLKTYLEVGEALFRIQTGRLYRAGHATFESYVTTVWSFKRAHAYRLINAYRVQESVQDETGTALNEAQARVLVPLTTDQRHQVLRRAKELAGDKKRSAGHIKQAADEILGRTPKAPRSSKKGTQSEDDQSNEGGGEGKPTPLPPPPAPSFGAGMAGTVVRGTVFNATKPIDQIIEQLRKTREAILESRDFDAAIALMFRLEADLQVHVAKVRFASINVTYGDTEPARELGAA